LDVRRNVAISTVSNWSDLGVSGLLPTGTVTLLLADVEGSTRLWQTQPEHMTTAIARLDAALGEIIAAHGGVRPVEQGEGDSFVLAFARASDAVVSAMDLQRAPLAPIRLRIGVHTGEVQLRDEGNYIGPAINRTARLRDLGHGGQTLLSGATEPLVVDCLPAEAWLTDLGTHPLRDLARPERIVQLCHPDLRNEFPPLRTTETVTVQHLPAQLTSFVGRAGAMIKVRELVAGHRLVSLTGAGGVGKTRLAVQVAAESAGQFRDGVWLVDLSPITDPDLVPVTVGRALGLQDQPGRSILETLTRFVGKRRMLVVLDNCEHLLDPSAALVNALLAACPGLTFLATSREPIRVPGEVDWRVPSLSLADEAIELFIDRARRARPDFALTDDAEAAAAVGEICRRLDGMPLAIELAAARVRALTVLEILEGLHDRFRLLTGGARTAVRRQQTLRASVDWSHELLSAPERVLFRRVAAFTGGFDLYGAQAVGAGGDVKHYQVLDQLGLLVDKSLVIADDRSSRMRYRLLETVRQYGLEKLGESGEADEVRTRHRDHYTAVAACLDTRADAGHDQRIEQADAEIDNLRAAFKWSRERCDTALALALASSLQPLWTERGRVREGVAWLNAALADDNEDPAVPQAVRARALADSALVGVAVGAAADTGPAERAIAIAREVGDPALLIRALTAYAGIVIYNAKLARPYLAEAIELARAVGDRWTLSQILPWQAFTSITAGEPIAARAAAEEGHELAEEIGDAFGSRFCRWDLGIVQWTNGDLAGAAAHLRDLIDEAEATRDPVNKTRSLFVLCWVLAHQGDAAGARAAAEASVETAAELGDFYFGLAYVSVAIAALAAGDVGVAHGACQAEWHKMSGQLEATLHIHWIAEVALASGDLVAARRLADEAVALNTGWHLMTALTTRARVAIAQNEPGQAERDAYEALDCCAAVEAYLGVSDTLECLAGLAGEAFGHQEAARLLGAAHAIRDRMAAVRFTVYDSGYETSVAAVRNALGDSDFDNAWAEGAALSIEEVIAYARRGRGERKRPASGWASLTPTERDVVRLLSEGLANKDIAGRLFVSPRTVQTHLTHVYAKLGMTSRGQLAHEAARHR
jgi:predicted ATPase/class 3 adenylate cyclase/DNA-binding CsgD family transcriptional regulator